MPGRTWKSIENPIAEKIRKYLFENGGTEQRVKSQYEGWRVKFSDSIFTYYTTGTIYSSPSNSNDPAVSEAWNQITALVGSAYALPTKDFLIGLDETGKGEVIGHTVLTGVIFPKQLFDEIDLLIGPADTKKRHTFDYWDQIFIKLEQYRNSGFDSITETIPPWQIDKYNINKFIDITYQRILNIFLRKAQIGQCRIVLDDYGIGATLNRFMNFLEIQGAEKIVTTNAEDKYIEAKVASLISKRIQQRAIKRINENPDFRANGLSVGSGNAGDKKTLEWLKTWYRSGREWPWFVKKSFKTVWEIEGKSGKAQKLIPPIKEELLSKEFIDEFNKGRLFIQSLSMQCSDCGSILKSTTLVTLDKNGYKISHLKCPACRTFIRDASITLKYYCGYIIPDSSAIQRSIITKDLETSRFFADFTILLSSVVRRECDGTPTGKKEFDGLRKYSSMGRIKLDFIGKVEDLPNGLSSTVRDERIIQDCINLNAILLSADKSMSAFAEAKKVFTIHI